MLLSIGMIVKNEEKYLEQCLTALKPILDNVDSELIIADTGSTDNTVEIAKKFTENVFHFEWIDDFAAARNSTLDKAKGEWYMFIDADEIIRDCTPLIDFFNSGEYKDYGSATYVQRNYNDLSRMDLYSDYNPQRLTALKHGVRFFKSIHETFDHNLVPIKHLNVIADHYGYVHLDNGKEIDGATEKKTSRNLEMLFQELEKGNADGATYGHIVDCYYWLKDYDNAIKYVDLGLENCDPKSYTKISYINKKLKILMTDHKNYNEIIELCKFYFSKDNLARTEMLVSDSYVYFAWAIVSYDLNDYTNVINKSVLGFDIYRRYLNGKLFTPELNYCIVDITIPILKLVCDIFLDACIKQGKSDIAAREIDIIPLKEFSSDIKFMKTHLAMRTNVMEHTNYNKIPDLYYQLDKPNKELFINTLIRNIFKTEKREHFLKKLSLIAGENERLADILNLYNAYFINHTLTSHKLEEFVDKHGTKENETVLILMLMNNCDIAPFICAEDFDTEKSVTAVFGDYTYFNSAMESFVKYDIGRLSEKALGKAVEVFGQTILTATGKGLNTMKLIINCERLANRWAELHPDEEMPEKIAFALKIGEIAELHRKKKYDSAITRLKEIIGDDCEIVAESDDNNIKILIHYIEILRADLKKHTEMMEKHKANPEVVELAEQIKQEIRNMIDAWDLDGADRFLDQMAQLAPFDPDIEDIRDEINDRKINYMKYM